MNKSDLRKKWSKYCDTDKLVDDVRALYSHNRHGATVHGVCKILDEYFTQKEELIKLFMTSKNYIGNMRIAIPKEFERQISSNEIYGFFRDISTKLNINMLLKYEDADGKKFIDYLPTGQNVYDINNLPSTQQQKERKSVLDKFDRFTFATTESKKKYDEFDTYLEHFNYVTTSKLNDDYAPYTDAPVLKKGTKTSRAFNTVCCHYGVDKLNPTVVENVDADGTITERIVYPYNKVFAAYSDLVSDLARKMWFVISLNPLDYLTMSNGVSWKSCHNIYDGCYKGGTLSYMLDKTSIITFVVSDLTDPIHGSPKLYRQMFHYDNNLFMQNRLYPQANDGAVDLYDRFRGFIIEEFKDLLRTNEEWEVRAGARACTDYTESTGAHYKDYHGNNRCNIFYPAEKKPTALDHYLMIGHAGICAKCGKPYTSNGRLTHQNGDFECTAE